MRQEFKQQIETFIIQKRITKSRSVRLTNNLRSGIVLWYLLNLEHFALVDDAGGEKYKKIGIFAGFNELAENGRGNISQVNHINFGIRVNEKRTDAGPEGITYKDQFTIGCRIGIFDGNQRNSASEEDVVHINALFIIEL